MAKHIYLETAAPSVAPIGVGHHYVRTDTKEQWISLGTTSVADWEKIPKFSDLPGGGGLTYGYFPIADNQSAYANISGLVFDKDDIQSVVLNYTIIRTDGTNYRRETGHMRLGYDPVNGWRLIRTGSFDDSLNTADAIAVVSSTGQVQYKSDAMGGSYQGQITWSVINEFANEGF